MLIFAYIMSTVSQVLVVYMYSDGLLGTHAFEMSLERHDLFSLVYFCPFLPSELDPDTNCRCLPCRLSATSSQQSSQNSAYAFSITASPLLRGTATRFWPQPQFAEVVSSVSGSRCYSPAIRFLHHGIQSFWLIQTLSVSIVLLCTSLKQALVQRRISYSWFCLFLP